MLIHIIVDRFLISESKNAASKTLVLSFFFFRLVSPLLLALMEVDFHFHFLALFPLEEGKLRDRESCLLLEVDWMTEY